MLILSTLLELLELQSFPEGQQRLLQTVSHTTGVDSYH